MYAKIFTVSPLRYSVSYTEEGGKYLNIHPEEVVFSRGFGASSVDDALKQANDRYDIRPYFGKCPETGNYYRPGDPEGGEDVIEIYIYPVPNGAWDEECRSVYCEQAVDDWRYYYAPVNIDKLQYRA